MLILTICRSSSSDCVLAIMQISQPGTAEHIVQKAICKRHSVAEMTDDDCYSQAVLGMRSNVSHRSDAAPSCNEHRRLHEAEFDAIVVAIMAIHAARMPNQCRRSLQVLGCD